MAHDKQTRFSNLVLEKLRKQLVLKDNVVFNNRYEGSPTAGAVKIPVRDTEVAARDYNTASGLNPEEGATTYLSLPITKDKAVNEIIDGYAADAVPDGLVAERLDSAGYSLALSIDNDGGTALLAGGKAFSMSGLDAETIYDQVVDIRKEMVKDNVPNDGKRYLLVTPDAYAVMLKDKDNFIRESDLSQQIKATGAIGQYAGFNVYEWNDSTANLFAIAGHPSFATRAHEWEVPVELVDLKGSSQYIGASAVQGRYVYDHVVTREKGVRLCYYPAALTLAVAHASAGKVKVTVTGEGTFKYKVNPTERAKYDQADTGFTSLTSGSTEITAGVGDTIEVVKIASSKVTAVGYITVPEQ